MATFQDRIRSLRIGKGLTQTQLAAHIEKGESAVRMWEIGRSKPDADTLIKLAEYFDCSTDYLLGLSDFENPENKEFYVSLLNSISDFLTALPHEQRQQITDMLEDIIAGYEWSDSDLKEPYLELLAGVIAAYSESALYWHISEDLPDGKSERHIILSLKILEGIQNVAQNKLNTFYKLVNKKLFDILPTDFDFVASNDIKNYLNEFINAGWIKDDKPPRQTKEE